jgi:hypothetical protein
MVHQWNFILIFNVKDVRKESSEEDSVMTFLERTQKSKGYCGTHFE